MGRNYTQSSASHPIPIIKRRMGGTVVPTRHQASQLRGNTETIRSFQNPVTHTTAWPRLQPLYPVNEVQDFSPADYLSQSPDFTWPMSYSSSPPTSNTTSPAMSHSNTNDVLSGKIGMLRVDPNASHRNYSVASNSTIANAYKVDDVAVKTFPQSSFSSLDEKSVVSQSQTSFHDNSYSTKAKIPKIVEATSGDGTIRHKAEIPRTTRQQPQRRTTFCQLCYDHPQGFHGEHELRRHVERRHTTHRKVWICKDNTLADGRRPAVPLSSCKACRNGGAYGANYNAAAHLRRAHFFPYKNKRGHGKANEGRGGMGGGEEPPMNELKNWMYERMENNAAGNVLQSTSPRLSQIDTAIFTKFNQFDNTVSYNHPTLGIPQESANWSTTRSGVGLVSESYQFVNSAGSVIESEKPLSRMKSDGLERRRYVLTGPQPVDAVVPPEILSAEEERVLKELLLGKECSVCGEPTTDSRAVHGALTPSCTHKWSVVICREDLERYLATRIAPEDGRVSSSIPCWAPNCNAILRHHDIQQHTNIQDFEAYDDALLQQAIHAGESFAECSTSGCRGGGWVDSTSNITYFICDLCDRTTCIEHNGPYESHAGKPCPATAARRAQTEQERERREKEDRASEQLLKKTAQLGPCGHWVSKIDGCNHITCTCFSSLFWGFFSFLFPFYPFERRHEDKEAFANIISANQVNYVVVNSATSAARTTST
jgi:hypothetical protein